MRCTVRVPKPACASNAATHSCPTRRSPDVSRAMLATPLLREGAPLGALALRRMEVRPFTDQQVKLLETFADQAVIAIENTRLFSELQVRNGDLSEALEQQTATGEVLRVIATSPTDLQPVLDAVVVRATALCRGTQGFLLLYDGEQLHVGALHALRGEAGAETRRAFPSRPTPEWIAGRALLDRAVVQCADV